ncbi:uncharacterized protein METZ01_LOCUS248724, partial [marine metagenome]
HPRLNQAPATGQLRIEAKLSLRLLKWPCLLGHLRRF